MQRIPRATRLAAAGLLTLLPLAAAACGDDDTADAADAAGEEAPVTAEPAGEAAPVPTSLDIVAVDHGFELASDEVAAGLVTISMQNDGVEPHMVSLVQLPDDVELADFLDQLHADEAAALAQVDFAGGTGPVESGESAEVQVELAPGEYTLLCFVRTAEGVMHTAEGMVGEVSVVEPDGPGAEPPADVAGEVVLDDYAFTPPAEGFTGPGTYRFVNQGEEFHEMVFLRLEDGKTLADVVAYQTGGAVGEPPFTFEGGPAGVAPGGTAYAEVDLRSGSWIAVCAIPSPTTGQAHVDMGMVLPFEVS